MTSPRTDVSHGTASGGAAYGNTGDDAPDTSARERAAQAADQGKQAAGDVARTATEKAQDVGQEVTRQARDLLDEARGHVSRQAGEQHQNLVANLRSLSSELGSMAGNSEQHGLATELVSQAQERIDGVVQWLDGKQPGDIAGEVRSFAQRRPGAFLLGALAAGVVAGRLTRGVVAAHSDDGPGASTAAPTPDADYSTGTGTYVAPTAGPQADGEGYQPTTTYGVPDPRDTDPQDTAPQDTAPQNTMPSGTPGGFGGQFGGTP